MSKYTPYLELISESPHLLSMQVNITNKCFSRCKSCRKYEWPQQEISVAQFKEICEKAKSLGCKTIVISGGEPFAHEHFAKIFEIAYDNFEVGLLTSGIVPKQWKTEDINFIAAHCNYIRVSVDTVFPKKFNEIRGVDAFENVASFIKKTQEVRDKYKMKPVKITSTISKMNIDDTKFLIEFAKSNSVEIGLYPVHTWPEMELNEKEFKYLEETCAKYGLEIKKPCSLAPICAVPKIHMVIDADGYMYPCCRLLNDNGDYDETRKYSFGYYSEMNKYLDNAKTIFSLPSIEPLCLSCDRYREFNNEYFEYALNSSDLFL